MNKSILLLFLGCCFVTTLLAGPKVLFKDNFDNNKNDWVLNNSSSVKAEIKGGLYLLENKTGNGFNTYTNELDTLNPNYDYEFETTLTQTSGVENFPYGLVFGMRDVNNFYALGITSNNYYVIYYYFQGKQEKLTEWEKTDAIKGLNQPNKLKIKRDRGMVYFYVNGRLVHSMNGRMLFGNRFGYVLNNKMSVSVDDIVVTTEANHLKKLGPNNRMANGIVTFEETFDDNRNRWIEDDSDISSSLISGGKYKVRHKVNSGYYVWSQYKFFSEFDDFHLEADMKQLGGNENRGYGLVFGMKDTENYYAFVVSATGYYRVYGYEGGHFFEMIPWQEEKAIFGKANSNNLQIRKKNELLHFYINGKNVGVAEYRKFFGHRVGFNVSRQMYCAVDKFVITEPKKEIRLIDEPFQGFTKENMGSPINSAYEELGPVISPDGQTLYFLRDEHPGNVSNELIVNSGAQYSGEPVERKTVYYNDIWVSQQDQNGNWSRASNVGEPLNNEGHNFVISVSPDNNTLLLANEYQKDGSPGGDGISFTTRTKHGWSMPQPVDIVGDYNRNKYVSYFLSVDNKTLLMALEQEDGQGDLDFYVSFKKAKGGWTQPKNLGPDVNSPGTESTMFLAADNRTMYFSSNGFPGYGSNDIFVTKRLDDTWERWTEPKNLGPEVNTKEWDGYYSLSAAGDYAYLASYTNTLGMSDIFRMKVHDNAKPDPVVLIKGKVMEKKTKVPLSAAITVRELSTDKEVAQAMSSPINGDYEIVLPRGKAYGFFANKEGYYAQRSNTDLEKLDAYEEKEVNLYLVPLVKGETVILNNVFFQRSRDVLTATSYPELDYVASLLKSNPNFKVEFYGHTDNVGNAKLNEELSEKRAKVVMEYMTRKGIDASRMKSRGFGGSKPIADNRKEETRKFNRRVEMHVLSN